MVQHFIVNSAQRPCVLMMTAEITRPSNCKWTNLRSISLDPRPENVPWNSEVRSPVSLELSLYHPRFDQTDQIVHNPSEKEKEKQNTSCYHYNDFNRVHYVTTYSRTSTSTNAHLSITATRLQRPGSWPCANPGILSLLLFNSLQRTPLYKGQFIQFIIDFLWVPVASGFKTPYNGSFWLDF